MFAVKLRSLFLPKTSLAGPLVRGRFLLSNSQGSSRCWIAARTLTTTSHSVQVQSKSFPCQPSSRSVRKIWNTPCLWSDYQIVITPPFAESITEGDVKWEKEVGDSVAVDEVIAEIETDKTAIPVLSSVTGVIEELFVPDGEKVLANTELCKIKISETLGEAPALQTTTQQPPPPLQPSQSPLPAPSQPELPTHASIPTILPPIPPLPNQPFGEVPNPPPPAPRASAELHSSTRSEKRVKMSRMRHRIAQRLKEAQNTNAMLTTFNEVDMSNVIEMRNTHKEAFLKKHGVKLGFMSPFIRAACFSLQDQPIVNAVIDDGNIVYRDYVDISVAVATPKGLVVPVLRNVGTMNYADIEIGVNELGLKARDGTLAIEDMDGGTFTISNGGVFGSMFGTPIINPPQSAILGMHATIQRPVAINGKVEIRPMMYVALTYDHRLIDGREAVLFLKKIKSAVEDPRVILLGV
ncbi:dihydrolipoyllysine-residue succinyltransferase component of 2-oxoglutarate dehydrogenase complex, mitochondrial-like isoform X2 [Halichondria panicea]|uniref:dihydrolipoyllysine-residue succinyltransferase component of 2-oxoglutarate dehydrogenase complex, mitochondrial-like isoform X2 n=1 Tax=Halichondria panicea TaxID=6063 RepID=UPI00312B34CB